MPRPAKKILRIAVASVCVITLGLSLEGQWPRSSPAAEPDYPQYVLSHGQLMLLSQFMPSTNYWPHH